MHPLERHFEASLPALFRISLALSLVVMLPLAALDAGLRSATAPLGIVSFEIAGSGAQELLDGWTEAQRRDAILVQGIDSLFLVVYSTAIAAGVLLLGRRLAPRGASLARSRAAVAWGATLSGVADAIENTPMTLALRSGHADPLGAQVSLVFAGLKFVLLVACGLYLVAGWVALRRSRPA